MRFYEVRIIFSINIIKMILKKISLSLATLRNRQYRLQIQIEKWKGKKIIHFLHIGKTGGSAIKNAFGMHKIKTFPEAMFVLNNHDTRFDDIPENEKVFFVVRDPLTRFVSGFYSRYRRGMPRINNPWKEEEENAFKEFLTPNLLAEALSDDDHKKRLAAEKAMRSIGHVNTSYWDWFKTPAYLKTRTDDIAWIGRQEYLNADFSKLVELYKLPHELCLPKDNIIAHKSPEYFDKELSEKAILNLKEWYHKEYDFLQILTDNGLIESSYS